MNIETNTAKDKWKRIKGKIVKSWGKITDDELEQTKGDIAKVAGLVQRKYGETKESVRERLKSFVKNVKTDKKNEQPRLKQR